VKRAKNWCCITN